MTKDRFQLCRRNPCACAGANFGALHSIRNCRTIHVIQKIDDVSLEKIQILEDMSALFSRTQGLESK